MTLKELQKMARGLGRVLSAGVHIAIFALAMPTGGPCAAQGSPPGGTSRL
jgi:hypothetical protein